MNNSGTFPAVSTGGADQGYRYSMWADYCVNAGLPTPVPTVTLTFTPTYTATFTPTVTQTPVCANPTPVGVNATQTPSTGNNYFHASRFAFAAGFVTGLHLNSPTAGVSFQMALYSDNAGVPATVLSTSNVQVTAAGWNTVPIPAAAVTAGNYWIAEVTQPCCSIDLSVSNNSAVTNVFLCSNTTLTNNPSGSLFNFGSYSFYADYCP